MRLTANQEEIVIPWITFLRDNIGDDWHIEEDTDELRLVRIHQDLGGVREVICTSRRRPTFVEYVRLFGYGVACALHDKAKE